MTATHHDDNRPLGQLVTITEVADALGVDVRHVRRLVYERRIPYIKWGHLLRFDPGEIQAWIDNYRRHPAGLLPAAETAADVRRSAGSAGRCWGWSQAFSR